MIVVFPDHTLLVFAWESGTIYAISVEGIMGSIHVNLFKIGPVIQRCLLNLFLIVSSGGHFVQHSQMVCVTLVEDIITNISMKLF